MLDIGWSEMFLIAVVAIVVIGPKDLPRTLRTVGQWIAKARGITRDLQNSVNDMIAESEIDELRKAGESLGEFGSAEMMGPDDFKIDDLTDQSKSDSTDSGYSTPPATPLKTMCMWSVFPPRRRDTRPWCPSWSRRWRRHMQRMWL